MADLHWERKQAGVYETLFYANGYRYKIVKDESYNTWRVWYVWDNNTDKTWKRMRGYYSSDTLKEAKRYCAIHNERPRTKYKYVGKAPDGKYAGKLMFQELDRRGELNKWRTQYMDPADVFTFKDDEKGDVA